MVEAGLWLTVADASLKVLPFRHTAVLFGLRQNRSRSTEPSASPSRPAPATAARSAWAIAAVAGRTALPGKCLAQALAGSAMLGRRRAATTIHLGVAKGAPDGEGLRAHAWLRCGDAMIMGASGSEHFTPVAMFDVRPRCAPVEFVERGLEAGRRRPAVRRGLTLQRELVKTLRALAAGGISEVVVLKGVPLAVRVFGSVAEREMRDIDLLVHRRDAPRALATLTALGFAPYLGLPPDFKRQHAVTLVRPTSSGQIYLDLHWTAFHRGFDVADEVQWRHTERFSHQGIDCLVFDRAMTILHLAHHYLVHLSPKVLRDFGATWNLWREHVDEAGLLALARSTNQLDALAVAFARAGEAGLLDATAPQISSQRATVVLRLLRGRLGRSEHGRRIIAPVSMQSLGSVRWMLHTLLPRPATMRVVYGDGTRAQIGVRYLARPFELAAKVARAMTAGHGYRP